MTIVLDGVGLECEIVTVGSGGLAFRLDPDPGIDVGTTLDGVSVRAESCDAAGDLIVRDSRSADGGGNKLSCLFFPSSPEHAAAWMSFAEQPDAGLAGATWCLPTRCTNCQRTNYVSKRDEQELQCAECGQQYNFGERLGRRGVEDLFQRARQMGLDLAIDLASSVSVHLGIMTLGQVGDFLGAEVAVQPSTPAASKPNKTTIDPDFEPAVEAGFLTHAQAAQRGQREAYVNRLIDRHRISFSDACSVADNRDSLLHVIRKREARKPISVQGGQQAASPGRWLAVAAIAIAAVVGVVQLRGNPEPTVAAPQTKVEDRRIASNSRNVSAARQTVTPKSVGLQAKVLSDPEGWSTRIEARRPEDVLQAYCARPELSPLGLATGPIVNDSAWLGVFENMDDLSRTHTIAIRKHRATGRWFAGDGTSRIPVATPERAKLGEFHDLVATHPPR